MKKTAQKKKQIFIGLLMAICFLLISVQVQAATKSKISIKVNGTESATLEKNRSIWSITTGEEEKDKQILSSKVVYLKIPKGKELVTGYYAFNSKGVMDTRRIFHSLDTKIGEVRFKGTYYFGEANGRLWFNKPGWTQVGNKKYYFSKTGKCTQTDGNVNSLLNDMITVSDNESYNELVRRNSSYRSFTDGCSVINKYLRKVGCTRTGCHSSLHPSSSSFTWDGQSNMASAKDAGLILEKIYKGECVSAKYSKEMLNLLLRQTRRWKIPAGLPAGTKCANKTGENDSCQNDVAIVYGKKTNYVVCIFAQTYEGSGVSGIRALSSKIYRALNN